jgi:hypothetical protein
MNKVSWRDILLGKIKKAQSQPEIENSLSKKRWVVLPDPSGQIDKETIDLFYTEVRKYNMINKFRWKSWLYFNRHTSKQEGHPLHCSLCMQRFKNRH